MAFKIVKLNSHNCKLDFWGAVQWSVHTTRHTLAKAPLCDQARWAWWVDTLLVWAMPILCCKRNPGTFAWVFHAFWVTQSPLLPCRVCIHNNPGLWSPFATAEWLMFSLFFFWGTKQGWLLIPPQTSAARLMLPPSDSCSVLKDNRGKTH